MDQGSDTEHYKKIASTAGEALKEIGRETDMNAMRVKALYGIDVSQGGKETASDGGRQ